MESELAITKIIFSRQAERDLERVPEYIGLKLFSWVRSVQSDGLENVRKILGYHDEPLKGERVAQRSIRLNRSYRAIYEIRSEGPPRIIEVQEVTKHGY